MENIGSNFGSFVVIFLFVIVLLIIWLIIERNKFLDAEVKINEAFSGIDIALERRYDAVRQCFASAKNYVNHEQEIILSSTKYRSGMGPSELSKLDENIKQSITTINAVAENYPKLKADALFIKLQDTINDTEDILQASRRIYNSNVSIYNKLVVLFPTSIIAVFFGFKEKDFYKASDEKRDGFEIPLG